MKKSPPELRAEGSPEQEASLTQRVSSRITEGLLESIDYVLHQRLADDRGNAVPPGSAASRSVVIIGRFSKHNAAISGTMGLIPGPFGLLSIVPELYLILRNQVAMICEIGIAHGKRAALSRELIAGVLLTGAGATGVGVLAIQGNRILVRRTSLRVFQRLVSMLGGKITQQAVKAGLARWIPIVGAAGMAAWVHYQTNKIGRVALDVFSKDITYSGTLKDEIPTVDVDKPYSPMVEVARLTLLADLMAVDREVRPEERELWKQLADGSGLSPKEIAAIALALDDPRRTALDLQLIREKRDEAIALMVDLVAMAARDGKRAPAEEAMIREVGAELGFAPVGVEAFMTPSAVPAVAS